MEQVWVVGYPTYNVSNQKLTGYIEVGQTYKMEPTKLEAIFCRILLDLISVGFIIHESFTCLLIICSRRASEGAKGSYWSRQVTS